MKSIFRPPLLAGLLLPALASANPQILDQDNFVTSRGGADAATASRPSAVFYNPAGLAAQTGAAIATSVRLVAPAVDYTARSGATSSMTGRTLRVPAAFIAVPVAPLNGQHITLAVGAYIPFGAYSQWPDPGNLFRTIVTQNRFTYSTEAIALAVPLSPTFSLGATFEFDHLHADLNRGLGRLPNDRYHFVGAGDTHTYSIGALWRPLPRHSLGFKYHSKSDFSVKGSFNIEPPGLAFSGGVDWVFPQSAMAGYSFRPDPTWNLEVDCGWTDWQQMQKLVFVAPGMPSVTQAFNWRSVTTGSLGVTHWFGGGWDASAGYALSPSSVPDATFSPAGADMTHHFWSLGLGYAVGRWDIHLMVQADPTESRTVSGSPPSMSGQTADGTYVTHLWSAGLAIVRRL